MENKTKFCLADVCHRERKRERERERETERDGERRRETERARRERWRERGGRGREMEREREREREKDRVVYWYGQLVGHQTKEDEVFDRESAISTPDGKIRKKKRKKQK